MIDNDTVTVSMIDNDTLPYPVSCQQFRSSRGNLGAREYTVSSVTFFESNAVGYHARIFREFLLSWQHFAKFEKQSRDSAVLEGPLSCQNIPYLATILEGTVARWATELYF